MTDKPPVRDDREMDRLIEAQTAKLAGSGITFGNTPWHWVGPFLVNTETGRILAQQTGPELETPHTPFWDRWHHRRPHE